MVIWRDCAFFFTEVTCAADEFLCASGTQCVDSYCHCNGVPDCDDGSDENVELCGKRLLIYLSIVGLFLA